MLVIQIKEDLIKSFIVMTLCRRKMLNMSAAAGSLTVTSHFYMIMLIISMAGILYSPMNVLVQEVSIW